MTAEEVLSHVDLAPLLADEERPLSDGARRDLLRHRFSYYVDDLVVMTWDRAFVYEPRGDSDVIDVLEVANAQLLEMRYYVLIVFEIAPLSSTSMTPMALRQPELVPPVRMEDLERGLEYLPGCLDLARRRNSDLRRDFEYVKKKVAAAHRSNIDRRLRIAIDQAVNSCEAWTGEREFDRAGAALDVALAALRRAVPRYTQSPPIRSRH